MSSKQHSFKHFVEQEVGKFPHLIIYAFLEWTLIGLLFLDGFLSLISFEFADFFDLQSPCVLCTRIDHVLAKKKRLKCCNSYNDAICEGHKKDLSPLAYCHVHGKLADIRRMCEGCLLSIATDNDRSLHGALNRNMEGLFDEEMRARLNVMQSGGKTGIQCSCCGDPLMVKAKLSSVPSGRFSQVPMNSPRGSFTSRFAEEALRSLSFKLPSNIATPDDEEKEIANNSSGAPAANEDVKPMTVTREAEDPLGELIRNPSFAKGNRIISNVQSLDSPLSSPRFANRMPRKSLVDKVELECDPVETITANETDTEAILNRLKEQVRMDKKTLVALYMELDEERNASAVAANNAMAMITRLQAEKAAVQMEALQYQRMMEEQAEYDQDALNMLRDYLAKMEDELRELEVELEFYKGKYGPIPEETRGTCLQKSQSFSSVTERSDHGSPLFSIDATDTEMEVHEHISDTDHIHGKAGEGDDDEEDDNGGDEEDDDDNDDGSLVDIERERSYLLGQLRMLESRILLNSADSVAPTNHEEQPGTEGKEESILKEVSEIGQKLRALEEDSRFLKHALRSLQKDKKQGSKLLMEIAQNLQKLRQMDNNNTPLAPTIVVES